MVCKTYPKGIFFLAFAVFFCCVKYMNSEVLHRGLFYPALHVQSTSTSKKAGC